MKYLRLCILLCLAAAFFIFYQSSVDGVTLRKMRSNFPSTDIKTSVEDREFLKQATAKPFMYLGKGCQFYVFASQDDQYVLKFFKHKHLRTWDWLLEVPLPNCVKQYLEKKNQQRKQRITQLFSSCRIAFEHLPKETGIKWIHLEKTKDLNVSVTLINKIGLVEHINLDDYECILQKKVIPARDRLLNISNQDELDMCLKALCTSIIERCNKGIEDLDSAFVQNVGFTSDLSQALLVDFGQLAFNEELKASENATIELQKRLNSLKDWAESHPELKPQIESILQKTKGTIL